MEQNFIVHNFDSHVCKALFAKSSCKLQTVTHFLRRAHEYFFVKCAFEEFWCVFPWNFNTTFTSSKKAKTFWVIAPMFVPVRPTSVGELQNVWLSACYTFVQTSSWWCFQRTSCRSRYSSNNRTRKEINGQLDAEDMQIRSVCHSPRVWSSFVSFLRLQGCSVRNRTDLWDAFAQTSFVTLDLLQKCSGCEIKETSSFSDY